jgi:hypothetical protein
LTQTDHALFCAPAEDCDPECARYAPELRTGCARDEALRSAGNPPPQMCKMLAGIWQPPAYRIEPSRRIPHRINRISFAADSPWMGLQLQSFPQGLAHSFFPVGHAR